MAEMRKKKPVKVKVTRHRGKFRLYFDCPVSGRRKSKPSEAKTRREAEIEAAVWECEIQNGLYTPNSRISWPVFREEFFLRHGCNLKLTSQGAYKSAFNRVEKTCAPKNLADMTQERIDHLRETLRSDVERRKITIDTCRSILTHVRAIMKWARKKKLLAEDITVDMPKRPRGMTYAKGRSITMEEFERMIDKIETALYQKNIIKYRKNVEESRSPNTAIFASARTPYIRRLMWGLWLSGLRLGEALTLSWDDPQYMVVDMDRKHPMLKIYSHQEKGGQDRLYPIAPDFAEFLSRTPREDRTGPVFPLPFWNGALKSREESAGGVISLTGKLAGVKVSSAGKGKFASAHDFRRTFGDRWAMLVPMHVLQQMMRHSDISITCRYYVGQNADILATSIYQGYNDQVYKTHTVAPQSQLSPQ